MSAPRSRWSVPVLAMLAVVPMTRCQCPNTNTPPEESGSSSGNQAGSSGVFGASSGMLGASSGVLGASSGTVGASSGVAGTSSGGNGSTSGWIIDADGGVVVLIDGGIVIRDDGGVFICIPVLCASHIAQCGDCVDNDGDGRTDFRDVECLGPCDNTEGPTLNGGVGGETGGPCKADCYFDWGNGSGNDDCHWDHRCDPLAVAPDYPPEGPECAYQANRVGGNDCPATQSQQCYNSCRPLTPNGCDCFGCCTFPQLAGRGASGGPGYVWLGAMDGTTPTCTYAAIGDPDSCPPCTPVGDCFNDCGICEVCVGRPEPDPSCPTYHPDGGVTTGSSSAGTSSGVAGSSSSAGGGSSVAGNSSSTAGGTSTPPPSSAGGSTSSSGGGNLQCPGGEQPCGLPGQADCAPPYYCITGCCQMVGG